MQASCTDTTEGSQSASAECRHHARQVMSTAELPLTPREARETNVGATRERRSITPGHHTSPLPQNEAPGLLSLHLAASNGIKNIFSSSCQAKGIWEKKKTKQDAGWETHHCCCLGGHSHCDVCASACALVYLCVHVCVRALMRQIYKGLDAPQKAYISGIDLRLCGLHLGVKLPPDPCCKAA